MLISPGRVSNAHANANCRPVKIKILKTAISDGGFGNGMAQEPTGIDNQDLDDLHVIDDRQNVNQQKLTTNERLFVIQTYYELQHHANYNRMVIICEQRSFRWFFLHGTVWFLNVFGS